MKSVDSIPSALEMVNDSSIEYSVASGSRVGVPVDIDATGLLTIEKNTRVTLKNCTPEYPLYCGPTK